MSKADSTTQGKGHLEVIPLGGMGELGRVGGGDVDEVGAGFVSVNHPGSWDIPGMGNIWSRIHWSDPDSR